MKKIILKAALLACAAVAGNVHAAGVSGQGTWETTLLGRDINGNAVAGNAANSVFLYDTVLDVTWLRNANAGAGSSYDNAGAFGNTTTDGQMSWSNAVAWASSLNGTAAVGGTTGWRLPTIIDTGASGCNFAYTGTDCGWNVQTKSGIATQYQAGQTVFSEMAHLWYSTLGNKAACPPGIAYCSSSADFPPGWGLTNTGNFQNLQANFYWSGLEYAPVPSGAWYFSTYDGSQDYDFASSYAMAVRPGDVLTSAVPEPETYALMLAGLAVVGAASRRRKAA